MNSDVWKVAAFDRIHGTNRHSIGFLENFGAEIGHLLQLGVFMKMI